MPYKSEKQRAFFHTDAARQQGITAAEVEEYDAASEHSALPAKAMKKPLPEHLKKRIATRRALKK